jgi:glycosyltransferase involved in cell wall biosynthesis
LTFPLVSVVVPTYNYSQYISQAIESVLAQTYPNIEIVVIDDGSTDDTASIIGKFGNKIQYHFQSNQGLSAARNRGIELSSGTYIQFLDSDDKLGPQTIEAKVRYLNQNPDVVFACGPNRLLFEGNSYLYNLRQNLLYGWRLPNNRDTIPALCYGNIAPVHAFLTRLDTIKRNEIYFDESLKACEDYDFWLRIATKFGAPGIVTDGHVYYRKHASSMSTNFSNQLRYDAVMVERAYAILCEDESSENELELECLTANLAASIKIYFLLMRKGQDEFASRLRGHISRLLIQFGANIDTSQRCATHYLSDMRIFALKLSNEKFALPESDTEHIDTIFGRQLIVSWRYIYENLRAGRTVPELMKILVHDLQYLWLRLSTRPRIPSRY